MPDTVVYQVTGRLAQIRLNAPSVHNALSPETLEALRLAFVQASQDDQVKVVLLQAAGKSFCAGADLKSLQKLQTSTPSQNQADAQHLANTFETIYCCPKVIVAQVQGAALAGGLGLLSLCDVVMAFQEARLACTEVRIGFVPAIIMRYLVLRIGAAHANYLLQTGVSIQASQAQTMGLVQEVFPDQNTLEQETTKFCQQLISQNAAQAMQATKALLQQTQQMAWAAAQSLAIKKNADMRHTVACKRGIENFLAKRPLDWQDA